ncbi:MAG: glucose 1-dehydrogenase [Euzebyales bacterium]|jgi:threonine dehydrogenase-like Zn-dependent dehydrogenase|nr:glucose 1-dehydrogenase [Euzebyales bacterium]
MRAIIVTPGVEDSVRLDEVGEPDPAEGSVLVETLMIGVCGTDREIIAGEHGQPPPGTDDLVLGHESLGSVLEAPRDSGLTAGDLVVGIVRRPDPEPCVNCAVGEWDMCRNGRYTEHGIKGLDGYARERFRLDPGYAVRVDPALGDLAVLLEPASIVAKAWEHIERIGKRAHWEPRRVLVTGAGPIGLLAALMGRQRGLEVAALDRVVDGPKPRLVTDLDATYHVGDIEAACADADVVIEATGAAELVFEVMRSSARNGIVCLTGVTSPGRRIEVAAGLIAHQIVLENDVVFGSVNANRRHYEQAAHVLAAADPDWLGRLITRRVPLERWRDAYESTPTGIKTVIALAASAESRSWQPPR